MYGRINAKIGLPLNDNIVKSVGTGIATNLAAYFVGSLALSALFSIFPGVGSVGASAIVGVTCYALTIASGVIYLKLLANLFLSGKDPTKMDENSLQEAASKAATKENIEEVISAAKAEYKAPPKQ